MASEGIVVVVSGLRGAMGNEISRACMRRGMTLAPAAMTGRGCGEAEITDGATTAKVRLVGPEQAGAQLAMLNEMSKAYGERLVIVDFTNPAAMNPNAKLYQEAGVAFVMGTTGGDSELLMKGTLDSGVYAVIASNMAKQIVAFQATLARMAADFPDCFAGYTMEIRESHQKTKADTSGTAKDMVNSFNKLGLDFDVVHIQKIREELQQQEFGVPAEFLDGHAFHTYTLRSGDGSVEFQFKHNVCGRRTYAEGVADAVEFLIGRRAEKSEKKVFSMIDILESGKMS